MQGKEKAAVNPDTVTSEAQLQKELDKKAQELLEEKEADLPYADLYRSYE